MQFLILLFPYCYPLRPSSTYTVNDHAAVILPSRSQANRAIVSTVDRLLFDDHATVILPSPSRANRAIVSTVDHQLNEVMLLWCSFFLIGLIISL